MVPLYPFSPWPHTWMGKFKMPSHMASPSPCPDEFTLKCTLVRDERLQGPSPSVHLHRPWGTARWDLHYRMTHCTELRLGNDPHQTLQYPLTGFHTRWPQQSPSPQVPTSVPGTLCSSCITRKFHWVALFEIPLWLDEAKDAILIFRTIIWTFRIWSQLRVR